MVLALLLAGGFLFFTRYNHRPDQGQVTAGEYVDSSECASCHPTIYETFRHSGMGRSFARMGSVTIEDFKVKNTFYHRASDRYYTMYERGGRYFQRRHQLGPNGEQINVVENEMDYVLGSGNHARTYLHLDEQKRLVELPVGTRAMTGRISRTFAAGFHRTVSSVTTHTLRSGKSPLALEAIQRFREKSRRELTARGAMDRAELISGLRNR
jgi:hypothetical protein